MAKRVFKADLSVKWIESLKNQLRDYQQELVTVKVQELVKRLLERGEQVSQANVSESSLGKYVSITTNISPEKAGCKGMLIAVGAVKESEGFPPFSTILAIEFGAGIHHNPTPNPNADKFGFGVGTFPGQIHAFEDGWYYWDDDNQEWRYTHGVKATMPMYEASKSIQEEYYKIAKEVFSK